MFIHKINRTLISLRDIIIIGDNDFVITNINKTARLFFGWTSEEVRGKSISFLLPEHSTTDLSDHPKVEVGRDRHGQQFYVIVQTMRDPQATLVCWTLTPAALPPTYDFGVSPSSAAALRPKLTIDDLDTKGKRVLLRADFNVPIDRKTGKVSDDNRIRETLPTIRKIISEGGKCIIMSHLGRPKKGPEPKYSLKPVVEKLQELLGGTKKVMFAPDCSNATDYVQSMKGGDVLVLENLRFHKGEDHKNVAMRMQLAEILSKYADLYVSDAFGTTHRDSASMTAVPRLMGCGAAGYLMDKEVRFLAQVLRNPRPGLCAIVGGSKVSDKINLLGSLFQLASTVILGGAMAFTFLEMQGHMVGASKVERTAKIKGRELDLHQVARDLMAKAKETNTDLIVPVDHACATKFDNAEGPTVTTNANVPEGLMALDIGPNTIQLCIEALERSSAVLWNGPVGVFELSNFAKGTNALAECIANKTEKTRGKFLSVVGGGDTAAAVAKYKKSFTHISTGGGAMVELMEGTALPGLVVLTNRAESKM